MEEETVRTNPFVPLLVKYRKVVGKAKDEPPMRRTPLPRPAPQRVRTDNTTLGTIIGRL